jgi:hypothetical protein
MFCPRTGRGSPDIARGESILAVAVIVMGLHTCRLVLPSRPSDVSWRVGGSFMHTHIPRVRLRVGFGVYVCRLGAAHHQCMHPRRSVGLES